MDIQFQNGLLTVLATHSKATEDKCRIGTTRVPADEMVHRTQEKEFSNFSCLSVRLGNICMYVPSKGQGNIPTAALCCEQAKLSYEKYINTSYLHLNKNKGSLKRRME